MSETSGAALVASADASRAPSVAPRRYLSWFSAGAPSAVTAKLALSMYGHDNVTIAYTDPGSEHDDNARFLDQCEEWFGHPVLRLKSEVYEDTWDVWERRNFILGHHGAPCTIELKKKMRWAIERDYDVQLFGYSSEVRERKRAATFREGNPDVVLETPLIERGLTKGDCLAIIERAGIEIPAMYRLGYQNNNCIGCPKGGFGYWNKIRVDFPDVFERMSQLEQRLGHATHKDDDGPVFLADLDPTRGDHASEPAIDCSLLCVTTEDEIAEGAA